MGKIILCSGRYAKTPYIFRRMGTEIYSAEELAYYITHNLETIADEIFAEDLADFMEDGLGLPERAERFRELLHRQSGVKDVVVCILCSTDYYTEEEIKGVLDKIDEINALTPVQRRKLRADNYLKRGNAREALEEYEKILHSRENAELGIGEYGDVLHNLAVILMYSDRFTQAAGYFREAYERNRNKESLKCYLYALALAGEREKAAEEAKLYGISHEEETEFFLELERLSLEAEGLPAYYDLEALITDSAAGNREKCEREFSEMIEKEKEEYRKWAQGSKAAKSG